MADVAKFMSYNLLLLATLKAAIHIDGSPEGKRFGNLVAHSKGICLIDSEFATVAQLADNPQSPRKSCQIEQYNQTINRGCHDGRNKSPINRLRLWGSGHIHSWHRLGDWHYFRLLIGYDGQLVIDSLGGVERKLQQRNHCRENHRPHQIDARIAVRHSRLDKEFVQSNKYCTAQNELEYI